MKKILLILILAAILVLPNLASGAETVFGIEIDTGSAELDGVLAGVIVVMYYFGITMVIVMIIYAGIMFLTAYGEPAKVQTAKKAFLWSVIGIIVIVLAFSIINIIQSIFSI